MLSELQFPVSVSFMHRCLELARLGAAHVAPNPMVGAVLVHYERIIGEGWHEYYGQAHAEVNCIASVKAKDRPFISQSTMYVSLEPCAHFGKTPPCTDMIIAQEIPRVVIGCRDPFTKVDGKGIEKLKAAGVDVIVNVLEKECKELNKRFFTFHTQQRPYIILKWAQTADGMMAAAPGERLLISNEYTNRLVHQWRSEEASLLVGTNTALLDNPELTTRLWEGPSPIRLVIDRNLRLPSSLKLFDQQQKTIVFNMVKNEEHENLLYYQLNGETSIIEQILNALYQLNIQSVLVEGGAKLLQSFIDEGMWDEARIIKNSGLIVLPDIRLGQYGLPAPKLAGAHTVEQTILSDTIEVFRHSEQFITHPS